MLESTFKARYLKQLKKQGWNYVHLIVTNKPGIADTLVGKKGEMPYLIEFKAKGEKPDPLQLYRHKEIEETMGLKTIVIIEP